jgi:hypothetical protein
MNVLWVFLVIAELFTSASIRIKENKADRLFANAEYDKAVDVYIDLAKAYGEDSLGRYDLEYIDSVGSYDVRFIRLMFKIIDCKSNIYKSSFESEYSLLAYFIANNFNYIFDKGFEKEALILLANSHKNAKEFDDAIEYYQSLLQRFKGVGDDVKLNYIDCCIEENRIIPALNILKEVKSESEKQVRLNICYNFLSNNLSTCLEIGDSLIITKSIYGCLSEYNKDKCILVRLDSAYKLLNYRRVYCGNNNPCLLEIDTLISEDFYKNIIDFEFLIKTHEYKEVSESQSLSREYYNFSLNGKNQSYKIEGFLEMDPELEKLIF